MFALAAKEDSLGHGGEAQALWRALEEDRVEKEAFRKQCAVDPSECRIGADFGPSGGYGVDLVRGLGGFGIQQKMPRDVETGGQ